jgi:hypothetical protein
MMVEGLVGLRADIACAVAADGTVSLRRHASRPGVRFPNGHLLTAIIHNPDAKLIVVTDPEDRIVSGADQESFVNKLRQAGRQVDQYFVEATDDEHHVTTPHAAIVMRGCINGASHDRIAADLTDYVANDLVRKASNAAARTIGEVKTRTAEEAKNKMPTGAPATGPSAPSAAPSRLGAPSLLDPQRK